MNNYITGRLAIVIALAIFLCIPCELLAKEHVIQRGETIESIASTYEVKTSELLDANPTLKDMFVVGMVITIPETSTSTQSSPDTGNAQYVPGINPQQPNSLNTQSESKESSVIGNSDSSSAYNLSNIQEETSLPRAYGFLDLLWRTNLSGSGGSFADRSAYGVNVGGYYKTYKKLYLGFEILLSMNYGLSDYKFFMPEFYLGPGFALNDKGNLFINVPLGCAVNIVDKYDENGDKDGSKTVVSFIARPTLHWLSGRWDISLGFPMNFESEFQLIAQLGIGITF